jgi:beta-glucosidase
MDIETFAAAFAPDFLWGAATAAYQIEGSTRADGAGESNWDCYCATPGKIRRGETAEVANDHYRRYREDVALMREPGLQAYRFSTLWSRIIPAGVGEVNAAGLDFYDRLVDELLAADIRPFLTLQHFDIPRSCRPTLPRWRVRCVLVCPCAAILPGA